MVGLAKIRPLAMLVKDADCSVRTSGAAIDGIMPQSHASLTLRGLPLAGAEDGADIRPLCAIGRRAVQEGR
jgi:hypothetical protein